MKEKWFNTTIKKIEKLELSVPIQHEQQLKRKKEQRKKGKLTQIWGMGEY